MDVLYPPELQTQNNVLLAYLYQMQTFCKEINYPRGFKPRHDQIIFCKYNLIYLFFIYL